MEKSDPKVSVAEFVNKNSPKGKRSVLEPFSEDIERLVSLGYSLDQVLAWLSENGVRITRSAISQFRGRSAERLKSASTATVSTRVLASPEPRFVSTGGNSPAGKRYSSSPDSSEASRGIREAAKESHEKDNGVDVSGYKTLLIRPDKI